MSDAAIGILAGFVVAPAIALVFTYFYVIKRPTDKRTDKLK